eukprot:2284945-Pleurochrysis_carterae.AAC.1
MAGGAVQYNTTWRESRREGSRDKRGVECVEGLRVRSGKDVRASAAAAKRRGEGREGVGSENECGGVERVQGGDGRVVDARKRRRADGTGRGRMQPSCGDVRL